ncbi:MAG: transcriptional regulator GcvA [Chromatiaceae bacterium]|nr:transcriptional regulator GcvA [Chromatiaceae bacterium]
MRKLPPLNALRSFEAAARVGSFQQASLKLSVTPSAVSHQIKLLESFLGVTLFRRENRRIVLTTAGEKYLMAVEHALDEIDIATRRLMASPNASSVNISVAPAYLTRRLVPRIRDFQERYPDVELRLSALNDRVDFLHSDTDMAIYFGSGEWTGLNIHFLQGMSLVAVCSPRLETAGKPLLVPEDLRHHTLLRVSNRPEEWKRFLDKAGIARALMTKVMTFSSTSLALGAAIEGAGVALTDYRLVERELAYGQLQILFDIKLDTDAGFYLVYPRDRKLTYGMRVFRDWVCSAIGH